MLGYFSQPKRGFADQLLAGVVDVLQGEGVRLAGALQVNKAGPTGCCEVMDLRLLGMPEHDAIRISQALGAAAKGCRLDPQGLEMAVGLISSGLQNGGPDLVVLNKFGKQEAEGRGFRPVVFQALEAGLPVLLPVSHDARPAFHAFTEGMGEELAADHQTLLDWCRRQVSDRA